MRAPTHDADVSGTPLGPSVVDLFAGAGGLSLAFHMEGFQVVAAVELDSKACRTYRRSFISPGRSPSTLLIEAGVHEDETVARLKDVIGDKRLDVLVGGPPCQDFSPARARIRKRGGMLTHRSSLVQAYLNCVRVLRPRSFLFENVPGLRTASSGIWRTLIDDLDRAGYHVVHRELDAARYGVPQRRRRLIVVGTLREELLPFTFPEGADHPDLSVASALRGLPPLSAGERSEQLHNHYARSHRAEMVHYFSTIEPGKSWRHGARILKCHESHSGHWDVYGRIKPDELAPTMTCGCTNPSKGRFIHPSDNRGLTVREAARIQTFPDDWVFEGGVESESRQVGNAVPVKLGRALACQLRELLSLDLPT